MPEDQEEGEASSTPTMHLKSTFDNQPTSFSGGAPSECENQKTLLSGTWGPETDHETEDQDGKKDDSKLPLPGGAKTVASQFDESTSNSNENLEIKLKAFIRNQIEKLREESERKIVNECEKRMELEKLVSTLAQQVKQLQARLRQ